MVGGLPANARRRIDEQMGVDTVICDRPGAIVFDQRLLMAVNPHLNANRGLSADELDRIFDIPDPDDVPGNVGALINLELLDGRPDLSRIVRRAGLSQRTLQRRLAESGLSFSDLLKNKLQRRAMSQLCQSWSITEIALMLGYRDPAHFSRAFESWSGVAPSRWRELAKPGG